MECHGSEEFVGDFCLITIWFVEICLENLYVDIGASWVNKVQVDQI